MCGIAGFCLSPTDHATDTRDLTDALLREIEVRGGDATGVAYHAPDAGKIRIVKSDVDAPTFIQAGGTKGVGEDKARIAILHTRFATQGTPRDPVNNHPVYNGRIIAVHNGSVANDDEVFARLGVKRHGKVDSEAIPALIDQNPYHPANSLDLLRGGIATAWFDTDDARDLHLARIRTNPLSVAQLANGTFVFASTAQLLSAALKAVGLDGVEWSEDLTEGTYMRVRDGRVSDCYGIDKSTQELDREVLGEPLPPKTYSNWQPRTTTSTATVTSTANVTTATATVPTVPVGQGKGKEVVRASAR